MPDRLAVASRERANGPCKSHSAEEILETVPHSRDVLETGHGLLACSVDRSHIRPTGRDRRAMACQDWLERKAPGAGAPKPGLSSSGCASYARRCSEARESSSTTSCKSVLIQRNAWAILVEKEDHRR
ncbi:unnamed protein product [Symbiodinium sp. CCMP2592]|nr:unnamed protein product [Symbiodinium sp. CCMP2592]